MQVLIKYHSCTEEGNNVQYNVNLIPWHLMSLGKHITSPENIFISDVYIDYFIWVSNKTVGKMFGKLFRGTKTLQAVPKADISRW